MTELMKIVFEAAARVATWWGLAAFLIAVVALIVLFFRGRLKDLPVFVWIILIVAMVVPAAAQVIVMFVPDPLYHVRVNVLDPSGRPADDADVSVSLDAVMKRVGNAWEFDIAKVTVPQSGELEVRASRPRASMYGVTRVILGADRNVNAIVTLERPREARIRGIVVDSAGAAVPGARVSVVGHEETVTDASGRFDLAAHVGEGQPVRLHAEKPGYVPDNQTYLAGETPITITLSRQAKPPAGRAR